MAPFFGGGGAEGRGCAARWRLNFFDNALVTVAGFKFGVGLSVASGEPMGRVSKITVTVHQLQKSLLEAGSLDCVPCTTNAELLHIVLLSDGREGCPSRWVVTGCR